MYAYIKGTLVSRGMESSIVENNGIGYEIFMPSTVASRLGQPGDEVMVYTYLHVREDIMQLFGFADREQQGLFLTLLSVSGIGPKLALAVIDTLTPDRFALAVLNNDLKTLTTVKGLGKKGAQRLIIEIRDKLKGLVPTAVIGTAVDAEVVQTAGQAAAEGGMKQDVISALLVLGYTAQEAAGLADRTFDPEGSLETNINAALKAALKR